MSHKTFLYQSKKNILYALSSPDCLKNSSLFCFESVKTKSGGVFHRINYIDNWLKMVPDYVFKNGIEVSLDYISSDYDIVIFHNIGILKSLRNNSIFSSSKYYNNAYFLNIEDKKEFSEIEVMTIIDGINDILKYVPQIRHIQFPLDKISNVMKYIIDNITPIRVRDRIFLTHTNKIIEMASDELRANYITSMYADHGVFHWRINKDIPYGVVYADDDIIPEFSIKTDYPVNISKLELRLSQGAVKRQSLYNIHIEGSVCFSSRINSLPDIKGINDICRIETLILENTMISSATIMDSNIYSDIIEIIEDDNNIQAYMISKSRKPLSNYVGFHGYKYEWDDFISVMNGESDPINDDTIMSYINFDIDNEFL